MTPRGGEAVYKSEGHPFVRSQNIGLGHLILDDIAYIDEEQGNKPYTMPGELEYLQFNIETGKKLLIYNLYNFQFETFIKGIQTLTGKLLETK